MMCSVFLHGGWRCGSTYLWNKFRGVSGVTAYYEPFSEKLATHTEESIKADHHQRWDSRHPDLSGPYAVEYLPLLCGTGVRQYQDRFALQRYFVDRERPLEGHAYLRMLVDHANQRDTQAVSASRARSGASAR